jgi:hypothetical protein
MEIVKDFYKKRQLHKVFYAKEMKTRSQAYGEDVNSEFKNWQTFFFQKRKVYKDKFVLSEMEDIFGAELQEGVRLDKSLAPLSIGDARFELRLDGYVSCDGKRSALYVGQEIKAGALFHVPDAKGTISGLAVIGKPDGSEEMKLSVYFLRKGEFEKQSFDSVTLAPTLEASSHLFCLGKHIFLIHNSVLDYYYLNITEKRLERVAIGEDGDNNAFPWCQFVSPCFVTNGCGDVFWISDQDVYTFPIGYPRKLSCIKSNKMDKPTALCGTEDGVIIYKKQRGTNAVTSVKYKKAGSGRYLAQLNSINENE